MTKEFKYEILQSFQKELGGIISERYIEDRPSLYSDSYFVDEFGSRRLWTLEIRDLNASACESDGIYRIWVWTITETSPSFVIELGDPTSFPKTTAHITKWIYSHKI